MTAQHSTKKVGGTALDNEHSTKIRSLAPRPGPHGRALDNSYRLSLVVECPLPRLDGQSDRDEHLSGSLVLVPISPS